MHRIGWIFVRLSAENRSRLDRSRRHRAVSRDRLVNDIIADYFDRIHAQLRPEHSLRRRRRAA
jgi:hypothetical protein